MYIRLQLLQHSRAYEIRHDVMEKYRKGALGALPDPELINSLLSIKSGVKGDDADAK